MKNPKELSEYVTNKKNINDTIGLLSNAIDTLTNDNKEVDSLLSKDFDSVLTVENFPYTINTKLISWGKKGKVRHTKHLKL